MVAWMPSWVTFGLLVLPLTETPLTVCEPVLLFESCVEKSGPIPRKKWGAGTKMNGAKTPMAAALPPLLEFPVLAFTVRVPEVDLRPERDGVGDGQGVPDARRDPEEGGRGARAAVAVGGIEDCRGGSHAVAAREVVIAADWEPIDAAAVVLEQQIDVDLRVVGDRGPDGRREATGGQKGRSEDEGAHARRASNARAARRIWCIHGLPCCRAPMTALRAALAWRRKQPDVRYAEVRLVDESRRAPARARRAPRAGHGRGVARRRASACSAARRGASRARADTSEGALLAAAAPRPRDRPRLGRRRDAPPSSSPSRPPSRGTYETPVAVDPFTVPLETSSPPSTRPVRALRAGRRPPQVRRGVDGLDAPATSACSRPRAPTSTQSLHLRRLRHARLRASATTASRSDAATRRGRAATASRAATSASRALDLAGARRPREGRGARAAHRAPLPRGHAHACSSSRARWRSRSTSRAATRPSSIARSAARSPSRAARSCSPACSASSGTARRS